MEAALDAKAHYWSLQQLNANVLDAQMRANLPAPGWTIFGPGTTDTLPPGQPQASPTPTPQPEPEIPYKNGSIYHALY